MKNSKIFLEKNVMLVKEFDKYILEYPDFAEKIPDDVLIVMQMEGEKEFNQWAIKTAKQVVDKNMKIVCVKVTELKSVRSRIEKLQMDFAA